MRLQKGVTKQKFIDMLAYVILFWKNHLKPHFEMEKEHLFSMRVDSNDLVLNVNAQRSEINNLIGTQTKTYEVL